MRLLYTTTHPANGRTLSRYLKNQGIENQLEMQKNTDWGSDTYGDAMTRIWVIDEDLYDKAREWADLFEKNPSDPLFEKYETKAVIYPTTLRPEKESTAKPQQKSAKEILRDLRDGKAPLTGGKFDQQSSVTSGIFILCCVIFIISAFTMPHLTTLPKNVPATPITTPQINKQLLYDYPKAYELVDKLVKLYGVEKIANPETLPQDGKVILAEVDKTPYWDGFYNIAVERLQTGEMPKIEAPMFEKLREGEFWRLFTPCLLHSDILHILFNMLWLLILGKPIEQRLGPRRYIFLILVVGIISNTCQYLMSGPNFIGFSGVVCGLLAFIWIRQKVAPWEGYPVNRSTIYFLFYFIVGVLIMQIISFIMEIYNTGSFSPGIANTAHFAGAITGALLGFLSFFSWKNNPFASTKQ